MIIRIIDIETTGFDAGKDGIVEIASIDLTDAGFDNPRRTLVNPGRPIPAYASAVHHIVDDDVRDAPTPQEAFKEFDGADMYVAHNAAFDRSFLPENYGPWVCTYKNALRLWPDAPGYANQVLRYWLGVLNPLGVDRKKIAPHGAQSDVYVTGAICRVMLQTTDIVELVAMSELPALYSRFNFGKHKGMKLTQVPVNYLDWICKKSDLDDDWKYSAREEIARRRRTGSFAPAP